MVIGNRDRPFRSPQPRPVRPSLSAILGDQLSHTSLDAEGADQERRVRSALLERPGFSIKARLTVLFSIAFLITALVAAAAWWALANIEHGVAVVAVTESFLHEAQEARRFEKNYLLFGSDLGSVVEHLENADALLRDAGSDLRPVIGAGELKTLHDELQSYRVLIDTLIVDARLPGAHQSAQVQALVPALRDHGSNMLSRAFAINEAERRHIGTSIAFAGRAAIGLFVVMLVIFSYIAVHIYRHILARLVRLLDATRRFAAGDFSPILPVRKYKDEFSHLAIALNHMMYELERRQRILVESHKARAIGNLTAGVAHELNNPINNIVLTSEMLKEDWLKLGDPARLEMVDDLIAQAERARGIVKHLLDFARESETTVEHLAIAKLLDEVLRLAQNQIKLNKIKLVTEVPPHLPPVFGDRNLLVQVFLNLILNAIDAMPRGGHLFIRVAEETDTGFLTVHVQDTGVGIPAHLLPSIFDPFFTTKPTGKGTGLGLAVTQGIVNQHGGDIEVMSRPGVGTTFTVHLPCVPVPAELGQPAAPVNPSTALPTATDPTSPAGAAGTG